MNSNKKSTITLGALMGLTAISGSILSAPASSAANNATASISLTVPVSCNLTISNGTLNKEATAGTNNNIGTATFKTTCNDGSGYSVYMVGYTGDAIGGTSSTKLVATTGTIATGTATSGATSAWGVTLATSGTSYVPTITTGWASTLKEIPESYTKIATLSGTTDQSTGSSFTAAFSAYVASTQPAGTYTGKVKFTMVHPANATAPTT